MEQGGLSRSIIFREMNGRYWRFELEQNGLTYSTSFDGQNWSLAKTLTLDKVLILKASMDQNDQINLSLVV